MTYQSDCTLPNELLDQIAEQDLDALPELIRTIVKSVLIDIYISIDRLEPKAEKLSGVCPCDNMLVASVKLQEKN